MESNKTLPKGFVQVVDCCQLGNRQTIGGYSRNEICVIIFSTCKDHT